MVHISALPFTTSPIILSNLLDEKMLPVMTLW